MGIRDTTDRLLHRSHSDQDTVVTRRDDMPEHRERRGTPGEQVEAALAHHGAADALAESRREHALEEAAGKQFAGDQPRGVRPAPRRLG